MSAGSDLAQASPARVGRHEVFEVALVSKAAYGNPFVDARARADFSGPERRQIRVAGFYDGGGTWRVRFVPGVTGAWRFTAVLEGAGKTVEAAGAFECVPSDRRGFLRVSASNPYRFQYEDGTPFYPIGQQFGWGVPPTPGFDAPGDGQWHSADRETVVGAFRGVTNLIRSQLGTGTSAGVALDVLKDTGDPFRYNLDQCRLMDEASRIIAREAWAHLLIPFQDMSEWYEDTTVFGKTRDVNGYKSLASPHLPAMEAYLRYVVARWGALTDVWEMYNEDSYCPADFLGHLARVIRDADPYDHPITTNYDRPVHAWCEVLTPHTYQNSRPHEIPALLAAAAAPHKSFGKPVIHTEFGNGGGRGNDDPVKWRLAAWTAFMNEEALVFWNMSGRKIPVSASSGKGNSNAYLGAEARGYLRVLADFTRDLPLSLRPVPAGWAERAPVEAWALSNGATTVLYLHNAASPGRRVEPGAVSFVGTGPGTFRVTWIEPATGMVMLETDTATTGVYARIPAPPFSEDAVARVRGK